MEIRSNSFDASKPPQKADITRPNRDSIERGTPDAASADDVRAQVARNKAAQAARSEAAAEKNKAQRIDAARATYAERMGNARPTEPAPGAAQAADVIDIRPEVAEASQAERAQLARESMLAERAGGARDQIALTSQRADGARVQLFERGENARDKVSLSDTSMRLRADAALPSHEDPARAEHVAELRSLHQQGRLNTDELIARAAFHMLSGE